MDDLPKDAVPKKTDIEDEPSLVQRLIAENIEIKAMMGDMEERLHIVEQKLRNNAEGRSRKSSTPFPGRSKPNLELCIYGNTDRESEFVRGFKKLRKKTFTFVDRDDLTDEVPIALVCECTQDRNTNDLNRCLTTITESQYDRSTIIYIHEVTSSQKRPDKFATRDRMRMTEEGHTYKQMDYRILDMLFAKDGLLTCKTNKDAKKELKTFVKEYRAKVEKRKTMTINC